MHKFRIIIFLLPFFLLTGCWNYSELNDLSIVTGISIDKDGDNFVVNYMISNANKNDAKSGSNNASTVLYEGIGETLSTATTNINQKLPKDPYLSHLEVIVMSEEVAKEDVLDILDFLLRNPESRKEIFVLVSKDVAAKDTLSIVTPLETFPSQNLKGNITSSVTHTTTTMTVKYSKFLNDIVEQGIEPALGVIEVEGDIKEGQSQESNEQSRQDAVIKLTTTAIFKKDKLVHFSNEEESIAINLLNENIKSTYIKTEYGDGNIIIHLTDTSVKREFKMDGERPRFTLTVEANGSLLEVNSKIDIEESKTIQEIKKKAEEDFAKLLQTGIDVAQEYQTDIFGLGNTVYKKNLKYWKTVKEKWNDEVFPKIEIEIKAKINLESKGSLEQSIREVMQ